MKAPAPRRLAQKLVEYSSRLEELTLEVRRLGPQPLTLELLDELAVSVDELLLVLDEHRRACGSDALIDGAISDARDLVRGVRPLSISRESVADLAVRISEDLERVIREDKRAA